MPVTFEVHTDEYKSRVTFENDQRVQRFQFNVPLEPRDLLFDPDKDVLHRSSVQAVDAHGPPPERPAFAIEDVFPNPASVKATIRFTTPALESGSVEIFDVLGRRVRRIQFGAGEPETSVSLAGLAPGVYLVRTEGASGPNVSTVVVAR